VEIAIFLDYFDIVTCGSQIREKDYEEQAGNVKSSYETHTVIRFKEGF